MVSTIIEVRANFGNERVKMKIFSQENLSEYQRKYFSTLKRDEAIKYGTAMGWKVIDIEEWDWFFSISVSFQNIKNIIDIPNNKNKSDILAYFDIQYNES